MWQGLHMLHIVLPLCILANWWLPWLGHSQTQIAAIQSGLNSGVGCPRKYIYFFQKKLRKAYQDFLLLWRKHSPRKSSPSSNHQREMSRHNWNMSPTVSSGLDVGKGYFVCPFAFWAVTWDLQLAHKRIGRLSLCVPLWILRKGLLNPW